MSAKMEIHPENFLGIGPPHSELETARAVILPIPYDRTTTYGKGAARGPAALISASCSLELYDEELAVETFTLGVHTAPPVSGNEDPPERMVKAVEAAAGKYLDMGKLVVTVGGEHSITFGAVAAYHRLHPELTVVQLDAHGDMRDEYEGSKHNHACVMRRIRDMKIRTVGIGIRSLCLEEVDYLTRHPSILISGRRVEEGREWFEEALREVGEKVYVTVDVDYFDPALVPGTGTPEPGGGDWYTTLAFLRALSRRSRIVGFDIMELAPIPGQPASDFLAAKLLYRMLGYTLVGDGRQDGQGPILR
ncbi:MAG: agmatinase [Acidobacteria bacterium]|nr:MAG: agmatinase [Acidobacteriota bacterium]